ncbi:MAG: adenylyltransferase/cytidyltransferase family protein [Anaerolineae bacterium]|nr:adenylyltransferase/cytidyltransferase family protein [Anaerolineae bacterium]
MTKVVVTGGFDDLRAPQMRFLHEASRLGDLHVLLWSDDVVRKLTGAAPEFLQLERQYFIQAIRYVSDTTLVTQLASEDSLPEVQGRAPDIWVVTEYEDTLAKRETAERLGIAYHVLSTGDLTGYPVPAIDVFDQHTENPKVIVTGCYDWLHSGHIRFFEEASAYGDLYVAVGNDVNVRNLKGEGHPLFPQELRRYMVQSIRYVTQAVITKGMGWMDAAPNIAEIQPDIYLVNEDGDKPEKRAFCLENDLEYVVLKREPAPGLTRRSSTNLRGF